MSETGNIVRTSRLYRCVSKELFEVKVWTGATKGQSRLQTNVQSRVVMLFPLGIENGLGPLSK